MKSTIWATFMVKSPFRTMIESWNLNLDSWQTIDGSTPILDMFLMTKSLYWTTFYGKSPFCTSFADELLSLRWPHQLPGSPPDHRNGNGAEHLCGHWRWPLQRWPGYSPYWDDLEIWRLLWERLGEIQNTGNIWESLKYTMIQWWGCTGCTRNDYRDASHKKNDDLSYTIKTWSYQAGCLMTRLGPLWEPCTNTLDIRFCCESAVAGTACTHI